MTELPQNRIVTSLWHCHDGWACSVNFVTNNENNHDLDLKARNLWASLFKSSWYRSSTSQTAAQNKLNRKLALARSIMPGAPTIEQP